METPYHRNNKVSIIIPVYNRVNYIGETLDSIIAQTYRQWECIIVDDGSTDYIEELMEFYIEKESRIHFHKRPSHLLKGANACRNYGFSVSKGQYINWFDSDDIMLPGFLEKKIELFSDNIDMVICKGFYTNDSLKVDSESFLENTINLFKSFILWKSHLLTPCILFRRDFLDGVQKFDPKIHKGQEAEFFSRIFFKLSEESYNIIDEPLFYYRLHKGSSTMKNKTYIKEYKSSEAFIAIENLKRSIELKDLQLINHVYLKLLFLYFSAVDHKDSNNGWFILKNLIIYIRKVDFKLSCILGQLIFFPGISGKRSYNLERKLRLYKID